MTPALTSLVSQRRFPQLEHKRRGGSRWQEDCLVAGLDPAGAGRTGFVFSLPLWLVPPLILILPPLIWGWLTDRVIDFLCAGRSCESVKSACEVFLRLLGSLRCSAWECSPGYLGAAPSLLWAVSLLELVLAAAFYDSGAARDLDLHARLRVFVPLVRALVAWRRWKGLRTEAATASPHSAPKLRPRLPLPLYFCSRGTVRYCLMTQISPGADTRGFGLVIVGD